MNEANYNEINFRNRDIDRMSTRFGNNGLGSKMSNAALANTGLGKALTGGVIGLLARRK